MRRSHQSTFRTSHIAEFERGRIRERQREGIVLAKTKGVFKGGKVRFDPTVIQQKRGEGMTPTEIARHLGCNPATVFRALRTNSPSDERQALIARPSAD